MITELRDKKAIGSRVLDGFLIEWRSMPIIYNWFNKIAMVRNKHICSNELTLTEQNLTHEMCHVIQNISWGWRFRPLYLYHSIRLFFNRKRSYKDNPLEKEANALENTPRGWQQVSKYSYKNYL